MDAYEVTLTFGHHTKTLLVIALGYGSAQEQAEAAMKSWEYDGWMTTSIAKIADRSRYSKGTILVQPKASPPEP